MNKSDKIVVAGFPGVGKSYAFKELKEKSKDYPVHDSDSSQFSWNADGQRNPDFPANYIKHIEGIKSGVVFVSTHKDVRDALTKAKIPFILVYPDRKLKNAYLARYKKRGSPEKFIDLMDKNWGKFIDEMEAEKGASKKIVLTKPDQYLSSSDIF